MPGDPIRLLMVEDDKVDRMAFERFVRRQEIAYAYTCVSSLEEARKALENSRFDVVVTDYLLGESTGLDVLSCVPSHVPVVVVTGAGGEEVAVQAMKAGAADYLIKDGSGNYLKTLPITVANAIKAKTNERELKRYHEQLEKLVEERTLQLQQKYRELSKEIEERKRAEAALQQAHDKLELRVEQRTAELKQTNEQLRDEIADRERAEKDLQKSKETMEAILNATSDCAFLLERDGTFVALNRMSADTHNSTTDELLGTSYFDVISKELAETRREKFDEVVKTGEAIRFEDQENGQIFDHSFHPVFESDGSVERVAVFSRDVTEQKRSYDLSVQQQRLAALGEMAGGVAHNFNNILQIVIGASGLAESDLEEGDIEEVRTTLQQIAESAQAGSETVKQLQDFARVRTEDPTVDGEIFDFSETVRKAVDVTRPFWKSGPEKRGVDMTVKSRLPEGCLVKGHQNELFEVVVNLIKNATEAMPDGGKVYVKTYVEGDFVYLKLADTGMGISEENLNKVFEPFWTTKGVQGTGMGLSTSFGIVSRHGGLISVKSREGKGTLFTVKLPFSEAKRTTVDDKHKFDSTERSEFQARILIIDDQPELVTLMEKALKSYNQIVFKALSAKQGLQIFLRNQVDLVVSDVGMPGMDGWELGKAIKDICIGRGAAKTPMILLTGSRARYQDTERIAECGINRLLEKPIQYPLLFGVIRDLLDENGNEQL